MTITPTRNTPFTVAVHISFRGDGRLTGFHKRSLSTRTCCVRGHLGGLKEIEERLFVCKRK
jgi:hypothetical protein